jgi:Protein of unknown function (DUF3565)
MNISTLLHAPSFLPQPIVSFRQDEHADWVAVLACGHTQHVRHDPPWQNRAWTQTEQGRKSMLGKELNCKLCVEPL